MNDTLIGAIGACAVTGPYAAAAILRRSVDTTWDAWLSLATGAGLDPVLNFAIDDGQHMSVLRDGGAGGATSTFTVLTSEGWVLVGASKATGSAAVRMHKYVYSTNAWTHEDAGSLGNNTSPGAGQMRIGEFNGSDWFAGDIELVGLWDATLTDAQFETLPFTAQAWLARGPVGLWLFDQSLTTQAVVDWTGGGANQTSLTGTAIATNHPPVFNRSFWIPQAGVVAVTATRARRRMLLGVG